MEPTDLLALVGAQLDRIGCPRFTTGSVASMVYGEPRFTNDIDIVVRLDERKAREVAAAFVGDDWYVSTEAAVEAVRHHGMFNIIHVPSGLNADLIVAVQGAESLDWQYMALWAGRLGVEAEFARVRPRD